MPVGLEHNIDLFCSRFDLFRSMSAPQVARKHHPLVRLPVLRQETDADRLKTGCHPHAPKSLALSRHTPAIDLVTQDVLYVVFMTIACSLPAAKSIAVLRACRLVSSLWAQLAEPALFHAARPITLAVDQYTNLQELAQQHVLLKYCKTMSIVLSSA